jgi:hypothetical protein
MLIPKDIKMLIKVIGSSKSWLRVYKVAAPLPRGSSRCAHQLHRINRAHNTGVCQAKSVQGASQMTQPVVATGWGSDTQGGWQRCSFMRLPAEFPEPCEDCCCCQTLSTSAWYRCCCYCCCCCCHCCPHNPAGNCTCSHTGCL